MRCALRLFDEHCFEHPAGVAPMPSFSESVLTDFAVRLLVAGGVGSEESLLVARSLVGANLRGHDSHGVMRIPSYLDACGKGEVVPGAPLTAIRQSPGIFVADAHWGFGQDASAASDAQTDRHGPRVGIGRRHAGAFEPYWPAGRIL